MNSLEIWHDALEIIKISVSPAIFSTWFSKTHISKLDDLGERVVVEIGCSTSYAKNTIETRYFGLVQDSLNKVLNKNCDVVFIVKDNPNKVQIVKEVAAPLFDEKKNDKDYLELVRNAKIKPSFTFENFAVSGSNQMAHAAALAVSENLGSAYNPLFIWGGVGVGKTHLMVSVGNAALLKNQNLKALFCTGEDFTNDIVQGIRNKTTQGFRDKYRKLNLLLIDDIQFIAGKDSVQEEFFHTFNAVTSSGGQIILTSDRPPSEIPKLEERLKSRFEAGLIVDVAPPDFELRCAITQIKAQEKNLNLESDQVQIIAANVESARKIEGILTKIMTSVHIKNMPITNEMIESSLSKNQENGVKSVRSTPIEAIDKISKYYQVGKRLLLGEGRSRPIARPRQVLMYVLRTHLGISLEEVGRLVGGRDHTTVMHAVNKITQMALSDVHIREDILRIKNTL
ncbi:MAG TPA: chromosomal replication initiator protein DnaA [Alphaproteobacteria bacterium]|jgi:chromosomal replication initiator protein|nr:chromosomal replication initiator protein DnaA [Alphaproteobacteria bacterium]